MKLTDTACKNAKPQKKQYKMFDGGGLYLLVRPNGSKLWQMKYRYLGTEKTLSIGQYPRITLATARNARESAKTLLLQNPPTDPMQQKSENKLEAIRASENTFKSVALEWHNNNLDLWSPGYAT